MRMTGGQMIVDHLIAEGVRYVFAIPGHGNTALLDAFVDRQDEITVLPAMHEQGAAHMADGYYRATGEIAAVITSMGPGATNALTGVATAYGDSIPLLFIAGGAHTYMVDRGILQEIDRPHSNNFPAMAAPVVKRWWQPSRLDQLPRMLHQAFNTMLDGRRGPVLFEVAQDLQAEEGEWTRPEPRRHRAAGAPGGDPAQIARAAELLAGASAPCCSRAAASSRRARPTPCAASRSASGHPSRPPSTARARSRRITSSTPTRAATPARSPGTR